MPDYPINPMIESETDDGKTAVISSAQDWRGNRFAVGDVVMYCIGAGRGQMMAVGEVLEIKGERKTRQTWTGERDADGRAIYTEPVPYWDITVKVLTHQTSGSWDNGKRTRPAWVNPMNITSIKEEA